MPAAPVDDHAYGRGHPSMRAHNIHRLLHPPTARHDIFRDNEALASRDLKTPAQDESTRAFLSEDMAFPK